MPPDKPCRTAWKHNLIWTAFAAAAVLAAAPVWQRALFGFSPTLDQMLSIVACSSQPRR